ncbi:nucleotidyltransferase domain-containing protein [Deinococcus aquatilis]|uniref:nucleotidyltransferase domain-containing protein n=1 Tax=Deinococcus aquatilis TaxID=519440 RepID=UPI000477E65B|nr:nucleotidyltransferase family protein [Deinococcus aquatilis]
MPDLQLALTDLRSALGDFLERHREDGVFHVQIGGPGSVPGLQDLDVPELHVDLLPGTVTAAQEQALRTLGYQPQGSHWHHSAGWRLILPNETTGWRADQHALTALLTADPEAAAQYGQVFRRDGREAADTIFRERATAHHARTIGFQRACAVAQLLAPLDPPWMFAGGMALDLHVGVVTRPHDDLDIIVPRDQQPELQQHLQHLGWRLDASVNRRYQPWVPPLNPPSFQVHARHLDLQEVVMLDLMLTDLSGGHWRYRRDPDVTLPLEQARLNGPYELPYLTPEAVLLFKAGRAGSPLRPKDQRDFVRLRPHLTAAQQTWLKDRLEGSVPGHSWIVQLNSSGDL